jgi:hypothetical protein
MASDWNVKTGSGKFSVKKNNFHPGEHASEEGQRGNKKRQKGQEKQ